MTLTGSYTIYFTVNLNFINIYHINDRPKNISEVIIMTEKQFGITVDVSLKTIQELSDMMGKLGVKLSDKYIVTGSALKGYSISHDYSTIKLDLQLLPVDGSLILTYSNYRIKEAMIPLSSIEQAYDVILSTISLLENYTYNSYIKWVVSFFTYEPNFVIEFIDLYELNIISDKTTINIGPQSVDVNKNPYEIKCLIAFKKIKSIVNNLTPEQRDNLTERLVVKESKKPYETSFNLN